MQLIQPNTRINLSTVKEDSFWNFGDSKELLLHRIHAYPAKFPYFLIEKAKNYAEKNGVSINLIADVFCGCGTTALEAKKLNVDFWGCDINPVATLITKVKSTHLDEKLIKKYEVKILFDLQNQNQFKSNSLKNNDRIRYWFDDNTINKIHCLISSVNYRVRKQEYKEFFLCAISNILKRISKWLTKSIKPQVDPDKQPEQVEVAFKRQVSKMLKAINQGEDILINQSSSTIKTANLLELEINEPIADLIVTSPPYVTSYEYADLHQLSTLCLEFTRDYRELRNGSIGSLTTYDNKFKYEKHLSEECLITYKSLAEISKAKAKSVAKYFIDLEKAVHQVYNLLLTNGYAFFVIGNTKYKGVAVDNTSHLISCLHKANFKEVAITKRKISGKILTPYRDKYGRFSKSSKGRKVYSHEYIVIGKK